MYAAGVYAIVSMIILWSWSVRVKNNCWIVRVKYSLDGSSCRYVQVIEADIPRPPTVKDPDLGSSEQ